MIVEAIQHFLIPAPNHVKAIGYLRETIAIEARYKRCIKHWAPHLEKCKGQIITATDKLAPLSTIMILGSGSFLDIPISILLEKNFKLICVDIIHLPRLKKRYPEITFITKDVTGMAKPLYTAVKEGKCFIKDPEWALKEKPDLIVSLNLLSQLPIKLLAYAEKNRFELDENFQDRLILSHINWLKKQETKTLLVSDIKREYYQNDSLMESVPSLPPFKQLGLNSPSDKWLWEIAPTGEADKEISIKHTVGAWIL